MKNRRYIRSTSGQVIGDVSCAPNSSRWVAYDASTAYLGKFASEALAVAAVRAAGSKAGTRRTDGAQRVDLRALKAALATIQEHEVLVIAALKDIGYERFAYTSTRAALDHIVNDDFRSAEDPGSS